MIAAIAMRIESQRQVHHWVGHLGGLTINELGLVAVDLANLQLAVGGLSGAVTAGQIVDDQTEDLVTGYTLKSRLNALNVRNGVANKR
jgi:hypothetical protein